MNTTHLLHKATVLVVDDTADDLALVSNLLKDSYQVKIANNGEKALEIAAAENPPDLILLDIIMPGMDGYEVCQRLKADYKTRDIPVIFLTVKAELEDEKKGFELGAADYIIKPISPYIVLARVKTHLALKAASDSLRTQNTYLELIVANADFLHDKNADIELEVARRMLALRNAAAASD